MYKSWQENQLVSRRPKFLWENADAVALNVPSGLQFQVAHFLFFCLCPFNKDLESFLNSFLIQIMVYCVQSSDLVKEMDL